MISMQGLPEVLNQSLRIRKKQPSESSSSFEVLSHGQIPESLCQRQSDVLKYSTLHGLQMQNQKQQNQHLRLDEASEKSNKSMDSIPFRNQFQLVVTSQANQQNFGTNNTAPLVARDMRNDIATSSAGLPANMSLPASSAGLPREMSHELSVSSPGLPQHLISQPELSPELLQTQAAAGAPFFNGNNSSVTAASKLSAEEMKSLDMSFEHVSHTQTPVQTQTQTTQPQLVPTSTSTNLLTWGVGARPKDSNNLDWMPGNVHQNVKDGNNVTSGADVESNHVLKSTGETDKVKLNKSSSWVKVPPLLPEVSSHLAVQDSLSTGELYSSQPAGKGGLVLNIPNEVSHMIFVEHLTVCIIAS